MSVVVFTIEIEHTLSLFGRPMGGAFVGCTPAMMLCVAMFLVDESYSRGCRCNLKPSAMH